MSRGRADPPPPTWTEALAALPPALRLQVQRTVAADVAAQDAWPKPPLHAPLSRAYASGDSSALAPPPGLGVYRAFALSRSSCGGHVRAVARQFPSTPGLLAGLLAEAARAAGRPPPAAPAPAAAVSATDASLPDPSLLPLADSLAAAGLDAAYRVTLARALRRKLLARAGGGGSGSSAGGGGGAGGGEPDPAWAAHAARFPATAGLLLAGKLEAAAVKAFAEAQAAAAQAQAALRAQAYELD